MDCTCWFDGLKSNTYFSMLSGSIVRWFTFSTKVFSVLLVAAASLWVKLRNTGSIWTGISVPTNERRKLLRLPAIASGTMKWTWVLNYTEGLVVYKHTHKVICKNFIMAATKFKELCWFYICRITFFRFLLNVLRISVSRGNELFFLVVVFTGVDFVWRTGRVWRKM